VASLVSIALPLSGNFLRLSIASMQIKGSNIFLSISGNGLMLCRASADKNGAVIELYATQS
jgi:hypothetical protein